MHNSRWPTCYPVPMPLSMALWWSVWISHGDLVPTSLWEVADSMVLIIYEHSTFESFLCQLLWDKKELWGRDLNFLSISKKKYLLTLLSLRYNQHSENKHVESVVPASLLYMHLKWTPVSHNWGPISLGPTERRILPIPLSHTHHVTCPQVLIGWLNQYKTNVELVPQRCGRKMPYADLEKRRENIWRWKRENKDKVKAQKQRYRTWRAQSPQPLPPPQQRHHYNLRQQKAKSPLQTFVEKNPKKNQLMNLVLVLEDYKKKNQEKKLIMELEDYRKKEKDAQNKLKECLRKRKE